MTFNPAMMGLNPQQMQAALEMGRHLRLEIRKCPKEGWLEIKYLAINPQDPQAKGAIINCVETLAMQMAMTHDTLFGMKGKIIHEE